MIGDSYLSLIQVFRKKQYTKCIVQILIYLIPVVILLVSVDSIYAQKGNFVIQITFIDTEKDGPSNVSVFVKEYPKYSKNNIDLIDAMYDDDPDTSDGKYTTRLLMPTGLIETGESFQVCMKDEDINKVVKCYSMKNGPEKEPEKLNIAV
jgi:hypothetical protein